MKSGARAQPLAAKLVGMVATISVALVALTALALAVPPVRTFIGSRTEPQSYKAGDRLDVDPELYEQAATTVFLFARASCRACQASKGLMAAIVSDLARTPQVDVLMLTGPREPASDAAFGREVGLSRVIQADVQNLRLRYVPSIVVTDARGIILWTHEGILTEESRSRAVAVALGAVGAR